MQDARQAWRVDLPGIIEHFAISRAENAIYNAHYDLPLVTRVDLDTRDVELIPIANQGGHKVRVSPDGEHVYVGSITWGSLDEIATRSKQSTRTLTFDDNVRPFAITPDGSTILVQLSRFHGFHVVDRESWRVTSTVDLPDDVGAEQRYPFTCDHGIEFSPDGAYLNVLATTAHRCYILDATNHSIVTTLPVGREPSYLTFPSDYPQRLCVTR